MYYVTFVFFSYWFVPVLNYSSYTAVPVPYSALTLVKDVVWVVFIGWIVISGRLREVSIPRFSLVLVLLPVICLPDIVLRDTINTSNLVNTLNLIKSVTFYVPLLWISQTALEKKSKFLSYLLKIGATVGALAILQLLLRVRTYLELQLGSYPRAVATLGGPTPLAIALLFVCLAGLGAILHRPEYRTFPVYSMVGLSTAGVLVTTAVSPVVAMIGTLSILMPLYLAVHPYQINRVLKSTAIATSFGFLVAYAVPLIRYRILGAFGLALSNPVALATYRSRQARITDLIGFLENMSGKEPYTILFGSNGHVVGFEPMYLNVIYNQGILIFLILIAFLIISLLLSIHTYVNTKSLRVQTVGFLTFGYILMFGAANLGSPVWTMYPANVILYISIGWLISSFNSTKRISDVTDPAQKTTRSRF